MLIDPYISFIVAGRNDNYGEDFNGRLQRSVQWLSSQLEKHKIPSEFIISNYNPLTDQPSLREQIQWPEGREYLKIRMITTPNEVHKTFVNPEIRETVPLYEYIAKNIALRRAKGEYLNASNPDIIYSPEILTWLSKRPLKKDEYYRLDRVDFHRFEVNGALPPNTIELCRENSFRAFLKGHRYNDLTFPNFFKLRWWWLRRKNELWLKRENASWDTPPEFTYHCNCSGDFMTMHRDKWFALKGNPENTIVAAHTDAMMVIVAATSGLREVVLPWPAYHQNHDRRYSCDETEANPIVDKAYKIYEANGRKMMAEKKPMIVNDDNWGLKGMELPEEEW
ncbi:MAG: hypothetical protein H6581_22270 [Bacteroidia bacterium]|nr:hypothetical protein [Bacteroidia bacterium]